ncbi:isopentenyl-diphosphate Delta-isomerase [Pseudopedobacter beijingensis]|uniref:Isopentenyl-diphosphate delta-isomerase n=1 Tax=Pseudopedobacter beijingensis TaxID=1207056 RepID=A0ABW4IEZ7_9SPHI
MMEKVVLVDELDKEIGIMEKLAAHQQPTLHRAFSVCLFNEKGEMLLQRRADNKYHCAGLWTNTCCSHPRPGEEVKTAAKRRLLEEMGIEDVDLNKEFDFIYQATFDNGLFEHEFDHVFFGEFSGEPLINREEVEEWKYMSLEQIEEELNRYPEKYTPWFKIIIEKIKGV